jgi:HlyD family secretion protein
MARRQKQVLIMSDPQITDIAGKTAKKTNRFRRRWLLLLIFVLGGGFWAYQYHTTAQQAEGLSAVVQTAAPPRLVNALGEVLPVTNLVTIAGPTGQDAGRIARIDVGEGDRVDAGQILAVLDTEPLLKAQLDQAIADESVRCAALAVKVADLDSQEQQLQAQLDDQQVALERARLELDRRTTLRDTGLYEDSALADMRFDVQSATFILRNLQVQLDRTRMRTNDGVRLDEQSALAELESATAARAKAQADYAKAAIRAPISGRVLALFGRVGQQIDSDGFGEIGDTTQMMLRAEVYETDMVEVALGQPITATSRAFTTMLSGTVSRLGVRISGQSILSTDPAAIVDARVIEVWITLDSRSSAAVADRSGLQVTAAFAALGNEDA